MHVLIGLVCWSVFPESLFGLPVTPLSQASFQEPRVSSQSLGDPPFLAKTEGLGSILQTSQPQPLRSSRATSSGDRALPNQLLDIDQLPFSAHLSLDEFVSWVAGKWPSQCVLAPSSVTTPAPQLNLRPSHPPSPPYSVIPTFPASFPDTLAPLLLAYLSFTSWPFFSGPKASPASFVPL